MRNILGKCHCGNIQYEFVWPESDNEIPVRACSCTFCRKHNGVYTSHPKGQLTACVSDQSRINKYAFGTKTAEFYICARCGVMPFVTSKFEGKTYAVVNVNTFEGVNPGDLVSSVTDFDGESIDGRLQRRARNWIPQVTIK
ncbi:MAG: GFA family protein [Gammaproteobacteria bacterium]|nr:GFA family protein [Gammaproteobacteria bacterium]